MKKRNLFLVSISLSVILCIGLFVTFVKSPGVDESAYGIERERQAVLNELVETFAIKSSSIEVSETPHILINVKDPADIGDVREFLSDHLPYEYVKDYEIDVFSFP